MNFSRKSILTLAGAVVLAGVIIIGGIYGPTAWKVFRGQITGPEDQVVIQTPPVNYAGGETDADQTTAQGKDSTVSSNTGGTPAAEGTAGDTVTAPNQADGTDNSASSTNEVKKYREPDLSLLNIAPSLEEYFGEGALSDASRTLAFGAAWNIHQYTDGYLYGVTAGPQMNEQDIKKYIVFHKTLWEKQMENEVNSSQASTLDVYFRNLLNRGIDAFDSKDKVRIEQFHLEIHDLDAHLLRDDMSSKVYGATPFATKRSE
ncbi:MULTISPECIES: hypothetical protein [unclassified Dehalobacter]|uniref:hypothetical protein n=1 Tax=unclassified Dehalobacter TaxID=2635733 RepID=UPI0010466D3A|nr:MULTISPECIES: hypothetical protein [unclassified Dehalobacter]TCX48588.1 hypothetical protein C1I36_10885 [Dehalobacter sp. 14DCB1]TCX56362.1 hypothetical protein C1I38_02305 [Dehalobacter sp. 12DCB1]